MSLTKRLEAVEAALAEQTGDYGYKIVERADDETDNEALERAGLADWSGVVIFYSEEDVGCL